MSYHKSSQSSCSNQARRKFIIHDIPGAVCAGYVAKSGIAAAVIGFLTSGIGLRAFGSVVTHYPGFHEQQKQLELIGEWHSRLEQEKSRLIAGEVLPEETFNEYKLIGSLKLYSGEPTNDIFFKTYKEVIKRLCDAPRCYEILNELNKKYCHIEHEIYYHPYYVDITYFMCSKQVHQIHVARTFNETSKKSIIGTMYHELLAHGSQVSELTNNGIKDGIGRIKIMKQWERELEGNLIKWYAEKEMYGISEIKNVQKEMKRWISVFPEWNYFRIKEVEKLKVNDIIKQLLTHYKRKYRGEGWVKTTYLHKLVS